MPQDKDLYGQQRPSKKQKTINVSNSLDFASQLTSILSKHTTSEKPNNKVRSFTKNTRTTSASCAQPDGGDFATHNASEREGKLTLKGTSNVPATPDDLDQLATARRKMEVKARLYAAMKRGDYVPKDKEGEPLVDFDRKWAEKQIAQSGGNRASPDTSDDEDGDDGPGSGDELIEYQDEFGRVRQGTRAEKEKMERRLRTGVLDVAELDRMSARPAAPDNLIFGDIIQSMAFNPDDPDKMNELASKRDRSPTPPPLTHYDANWEIRTKGVGFYKFSKDEEIREDEMRTLEQSRAETESQRRDLDQRKATRKREIEERRKSIEARKARKLADSFLSELADDINPAI